MSKNEARERVSQEGNDSVHVVVLRANALSVSIH
jgi:hypothetical protein